MRTLEEMGSNKGALMVWWNNQSHTQKRILIGYKEITTTVFEELPQRIQLAIFGHWDYWYKK